MLPFNEEKLQMIESAARAIGIKTKRYTVRDHTAIHRILDESGVGVLFNPFDPYSGDLTMLITRLSGLRIEVRFDLIYVRSDTASILSANNTPEAFANAVTRVAAATDNSSKCKPGGCSSIGCEGGHYCFRADGSRPAPATAEELLSFRESLAKYAGAK